MLLYTTTGRRLRRPPGACRRGFRETIRGRGLRFRPERGRALAAAGWPAGRHPDSCFGLPLTKTRTKRRQLPPRHRRPRFRRRGIRVASHHRRGRRRGARYVHPGSVQDFRIRSGLDSAALARAAPPSFAQGQSVFPARAVAGLDRLARRTSPSAGSARRSTRCTSSVTPMPRDSSGCSMPRTARTRSPRSSPPRSNGCASRECGASAARSACRSTRKRAS